MFFWYHKGCALICLPGIFVCQTPKCLPACLDFLHHLFSSAFELYESINPLFSINLPTSSIFVYLSVSWAWMSTTFSSASVSTHFTSHFIHLTTYGLSFFVCVHLFSPLSVFVPTSVCVYQCLCLPVSVSTSVWLIGETGRDWGFVVLERCMSTWDCVRAVLWLLPTHYVHICLVDCWGRQLNFSLKSIVQMSLWGSTLYHLHQIHTCSPAFE